METLQQPAGVDAFGGVRTWMETEVGQNLIVNAISTRERMWRVPHLINAASLWQSERMQAMRQFSTRRGAPRRQ
jgi:hypothetical protein